MNKKVLFVDDEIQILKSLVRLFMDTEYEVLTAESGPEALDILSKNEIDLIISDMRMPNMDGYQLLSNVKQMYPKVLRIILSGYSDEKTVMKSLQQNVAKVYVFKPWDNEKLLKLVEQVLETEDLLNDNNLLLHINNIEELPTIKTSFQRIVDYIENDGAMSNIAVLIEQDQSIATKILQVANSAYYGVKTGSIKQAITYLGLINVKNLIISTSIIDALESKNAMSAKINYLWKHSFLTNKVVNFIYENFIGKKLPEISMTAGLLHNIGQVFLLKYFPEKFIKTNRLIETAKADPLKIEKEMMGVSHQFAGGYLLRWWELPMPIVEAALYHHTPFDEKVIDKELVCAVHIAQHYAWNILKQKDFIPFETNSLNYLSIAQEKFEARINEIKPD